MTVQKVVSKLLNVMVVVGMINRSKVAVVSMVMVVIINVINMTARRTIRVEI